MGEQCTETWAGRSQGSQQLLWELGGQLVQKEGGVCMEEGMHLRSPWSAAGKKSLYSGLRTEQGHSFWESRPQSGDHCPVRIQGVMREERKECKEGKRKDLS